MRRTSATAAAGMLMALWARDVLAVDYFDKQGKEVGGTCVCFDIRTNEAFNSGEVRGCKNPLGRLEAERRLGKSSDLSNGVDRGQILWLCGRQPEPRYAWLCCDTCSDQGCPAVMADQGADWTGVYAYPEAYATFNRSWPADYSHNYRLDPLPSPAPPDPPPPKKGQGAQSNRASAGATATNKAPSKPKSTGKGSATGNGKSGKGSSSKDAKPSDAGKTKAPGKRPPPDKTKILGTYTVVQGTIVIAAPSDASSTRPDVPVPLLVFLLILGGLGFLVDLL